MSRALVMPWLLICLLVILTGCQTKEARLTVSAAADLTDAFAEIGRQFTAATGMPVSFNFGSTGHLERKGRLVPATRRRYGTGRLVVWSRQDRPTRIQSMADLGQPGIERIAIANPEHAPYGIAAREALITAGLWEKVSPRLILAENVRQTLRYAESGDVDAALVALSLCYRNREDGAAAGHFILVPAELHRPLIQEMAIINGTEQLEAARRFSELVMSDVGREILVRYGFSVGGAEKRP
jgi:molybdate transport system substrate-binding protein